MTVLFIRNDRLSCINIRVIIIFISITFELCGIFFIILRPSGHRKKTVLSIRSSKNLGKKIQCLTGEGTTLFKAEVTSHLSIVSHLIVCRVKKCENGRISYDSYRKKEKKKQNYQFLVFF